MNKTQQANEAIRMAADQYQIHATRIVSPERSAEAAQARRLAAWLLRAHDPDVWSLPAIGKALRRAHSNAHRFCHQVESERARMPWFERMTDKIFDQYQAKLKEKEG